MANVDGYYVPAVFNYATDPSSITYVMRAVDATVGGQVYWDSPGAPDPTGTYYTGPGPISEVKVFARVPAS